MNVSDWLNRISAIVILLILVLFGTGCKDSGAGTDTGSAKETSAPPTMADMPDVESSTRADHLEVIDLDGVKELVRQASAERKVLVIDFWATWCVPCVEMLPPLHEGLVARGAGHPDGPVRAVTITLDDPTREADAVEFLRKHHALHDAFMFLNDSAEQQALADGLGESWNSLAVPAILVYDQSGNLAGEFLEGGMTDAILERVDQLLASGQEQAP